MAGDGSPNPTDPKALLSDLVRAETRLYNAVDDRLRAQSGTGLGRFELLHYIGTEPNRRVHDVANAFALTVGAASKAVDRMEAAGLCRRVANPADGRSFFLEVTDEGRALVTAAASVVDEETRNRLEAALGRDELASFARFVSLLRRSLEGDPSTGGVGRQVR